MTGHFYYVRCNGCAALHRDMFMSTSEARNAVKAAGWTSTKRLWHIRDYCPPCSKGRAAQPESTPEVA